MEKNRINVKYVQLHFLFQEHWKNIVELTVERNHTSVMSVQQHSLNQEVWKDMLEFTLERNHLSVSMFSYILPVSTFKKTFKNSQWRETYKCEVCLATFTKFWKPILEFTAECSHSGHLKDHLKVNSGENTYKFEVCSATFSQSGTLKKHCRIHICERLKEWCQENVI